MIFRDIDGKIFSLERSAFTLNKEYFDALTLLLTKKSFNKTNNVCDDISNLISNKNV